MDIICLFSFIFCGQLSLQAVCLSKHTVWKPCYVFAFCGSKSVGVFECMSMNLFGHRFMYVLHYRLNAGYHACPIFGSYMHYMPSRVNNIVSESVLWKHGLAVSDVQKINDSFFSTLITNILVFHLSFREYHFSLAYLHKSQTIQILQFHFCTFLGLNHRNIHLKVLYIAR